MAAAVLLAGRADSREAAEVQLEDNGDRVAYLESLGWQVEAEPVETLQFLLPAELEEPYLTYNELQSAQGFDLSACCGKQVSRYTLHRHQLPRPGGGRPGQSLCVPGPAGGGRHPLRRGGRVPGHPGLPGDGGLTARSCRAAAARRARKKGLPLKSGSPFVSLVGSVTSSGKGSALDDVGDSAGTHGTATLTDSEAQALLNGRWG